MFVILNDAANFVLYMPLILIALCCCAYLSFRFATR
jgi:hypothetical protein